MKIMPKMTYLFSAVLFLLFTFSAGLSLENLNGRQSISSSKPYSTDRLLHELKDQMQNGRGAGVNLGEAQLSSKKKKSSNDLQEYMPKSEVKDDSYNSAGNGYYGNEDSLGPAWDPLYSYSDLHSFRADVKRNKRARKEEEEGNNQELADILKDDESDKKPIQRDRKVPPDVKRQEGHHGKKKRQSDDPSMLNLKDLNKDQEQQQQQQQNPDFQDWLRREYYRNMAKSFASMRRKRAGWGPLEGHNNDSRSPQNAHRRIAKQAGPSPPSVQKKGDRFEEVTDNLKNIEDALLSDALRVINENGGDYADDEAKRNRITNDLNAAYDLETMRTALFHLKETLSNMEDDDDDSDMDQYSVYGNYRKRGDQCPPLDLLTSDCSALSDIVTEGPLKQLLLAACNWHEVCYTCGEAFGLTSDNCDVGFVEQSHTICQGDVPCQTTAGLLLLPLRQRRVFYKRSNPSVCFVDPCVEEFLKQG